MVLKDLFLFPLKSVRSASPSPLVGLTSHTHRLVFDSSTNYFPVHAQGDLSGIVYQAVRNTGVS